jgi:hypothetical protein
MRFEGDVAGDTQDITIHILDLDFAEFTGHAIQCFISVSFRIAGTPPIEKSDKAAKDVRVLLGGMLAIGTKSFE